MSKKKAAKKTVKKESIFDVVGSEIDTSDHVILDFESINVFKPSQYDLNLAHIFKEIH